jgi:hypothetical protein
MPYSTTKPKIEAWDPNQVKNNEWVKWIKTVVIEE